MTPGVPPLGESYWTGILYVLDGGPWVVTQGALGI